MLTIDYLQDPALPGAENMGRDEALLRLATAESRPVLRTYGWSTPTISLGFFQGVNEVESHRKQVRDLPIVRRSTGGGAILHDLELTYSLVMPLAHPLIAGKPNNLYTLVHRAISAAVGSTLQVTATVGMHRENEPAARMGLDAGHRAQHGPFFCFARRSDFDVVVNRVGGTVDKLAGSAQRRTKTAVLQHGSIILATRFDDQPCATWSGCGLHNVDFEEAGRRFVEAFGSTFEASLARRDWSSEELSAAAQYRDMHASRAWIHDRLRPSEREP